MGGAAEPGSLTLRLQWWLRILSTNKQSHILLRLLQHLRGTRATIAAGWVSLALMLVDAALSSSWSEAQFGINLAVTFICTLPAQALFAYHTPLLRDSVGGLCRLVHNVEDDADAECRERLRRASRRDFRFIAFYGTCTTLMLSVPYDLFSSDWEAGWLTDGVASAVGLRTHAWLPVVVKLLLSYALFPCCYSYYSLLLYVHMHANVCSELLYAVAHGLENGAFTPRWAAVQSGALRAGLELDSVLPVPMTILMIAPLLMPLTSTVEVMLSRGAADSYSLVCVPTIFTEFVPFCETGDRAGEARASLATGAYFGPWQEEPLQQARLRLGLIQVSRGREVRLRVLVLGPLNREVCMDILKSWFSWLQVLYSVQPEQQ